MKEQLPRLDVESTRYMAMRLSGWIFQWIKMGSGGRSWKRETDMVEKDGLSVLDP